MSKEKDRNNKDDVFNIDEFDVEIDPEEPVYPLNVVCRLLDLNYWTLHEIIEEGLVHYRKKNKLFSYRDIKRLKYIKYLIEDRGVNIKGIKVIFEIKRDI